ncbi:MAG: metal-dependent hydrolase [Saprospiraceae bacterium]|nr:metal-dependent hydrolase [Saprospiraceae bacterium]
MDSLTQIVLGAACGEAVLGKKIGNKALIWGAVAGTIPDLDVLSNYFMGELDALVFHRGPMHSLLFATLAPFPLAWLVMQFYNKGWFNKTAYRRTGFVTGSLFFVLVFAILQLAFYLFFGNWAFSLSLLLLPSLVFIVRKMYLDYWSKTQEYPNVSYRDWVLLFFVSIITHPLLDALTTFGTRLYWPFSNERVSISTISIADPIYTLPFLFSVVLCGFYGRTDRRRRTSLWVGIAVSSIYLSATYFTKSHVEKVMHANLIEEGVQAEKMISVPTIFNNLLWYGIARHDHHYYCQYYSILDENPAENPIVKIADGKEWLGADSAHHIVKTLDWFGDGYTSVIRKNGDTLQWNDLRFGSLNFKFEKPEDFVFHFDLIQSSKGLKYYPNRERPSPQKDQMVKFWRRAFGEK